MGRIIMCYAGVGKSTLAAKSDYIDLDSRFFEDKVRYALLALYLAAQGKDVLVSAHEELYNNLKWYKVKNHHYDVELITVYPSIVLKEAWCKRLMDRCLVSGSGADKAALLRAVDCYDADVEDMSKRENAFEIGDINSYDLAMFLASISVPTPDKEFRKQTNGCEPAEGDYVYVDGVKWVYDGEEWTC